MNSTVPLVERSGLVSPKEEPRPRVVGATSLRSTSGSGITLALAAVGADGTGPLANKTAASRFDAPRRERERWLLALPMKAACTLCPVTFTGRAADGIAWQRAHRAEFHPGLRDRGQKARLRAKPKGLFQ